MTEPTTPRGRKIYSLSCTIQEHAEAAATAYERGDILARSYSEQQSDDARDELCVLVEEIEREMATAAALVERAQAQTAEAIQHANALADQRDQARSELARVTAERDATSRLRATERAYEEDVQVLRAALTCAVMARTKRDRERARKQANEALAKTAPVPF